LTEWDKLWYDPNWRTAYLTHDWLKNVRAEGDKLQAENKRLKDLFIEYGEKFNKQDKKLEAVLNWYRYLPAELVEGEHWLRLEKILKGG